MSIFKRSNIPNFLSAFRLLLVPVFVYLFQIAKMRVVGIGVFLFAGATDVLDGILARKNNWTSNAGKVLDPVADKCMQIAALVCLVLSGLVPWWIASILAFKEALMLIGATKALKTNKIYVQSDWYGKAGTVAFYIIATLLVVFDGMSATLRLLLEVVLIVMMFFALVMYFVDYRKYLFAKKGEEKQV